MATSASARGWGPGWPANRTTDMRRASGGGIKLFVHRDIADLIEWLCDETVKLGYNLDARADDWGYCCRPIRGSSTPSNHSWGLAVDINATANPMGGRLITDIPQEVVALWEAKGFRWGGNYKSRPDAMHFEFMGTPADAARYTASIGGTVTTQSASWVTHPTITPPPPPPSFTPPTTPPPEGPPPMGPTTTIFKFYDGSEHLFYPSGLRALLKDSADVDFFRFIGIPYQQVEDVGAAWRMLYYTRDITTFPIVAPTT